MPSFWLKGLARRNPLACASPSRSTHLRQHRLEQPPSNGLAIIAAVLRLRAIEKSGDFDDYWAYHLEREREWNYAEQYLLAA